MEAANRNTVHDYASRLNDTPWLTVMGYAWAAFATLSILSFLVPAHWHGPIKALGLAVPLLVFVAKDLAQIPDVLARLRVLRRQRAGLVHWLAACLPPALVGLMRVDRALWRSFYCWLRRQPLPPRPDGLRLTYNEQGAYPAALAFGFLSLLIELPIDMAILPLFIHDPDALTVIHLAFAVSAAYTLVWLLGDRWRVRHGHHVLTATHLDLQIGDRASARIPLAAIADAQALREPVDAWRRTHGLRPLEAVTITPFGKPNLVLRLRPDAEVVITHHGVARQGVRHVFLYLDRPEGLIAALRQLPDRNDAGRDGSTE